MAFEHKENSGSLFKNDYKTTDIHPDYKGQINVEGKLLDIAAWITEGSKGKYFSLKTTQPRQQSERAGQSRPATRPASSTRIDDNDLPF